MPQTVGVLLMTFGTAKNLDEVPAYLSSVRGGREVPEDLIAEFRRRFAQVGGSPLIEITLDQAAKLDERLNQQYGPGDFHVRVGMRHSAPTIASGLAELRDAGATTIVGVVLSPQFSVGIMRGYLDAVARAEADLSLEKTVRVARSWHHLPPFIEALAEHLSGTMSLVQSQGQTPPPIIFTAHSLPRSVADHEPDYIAALQATAGAVAERCLLPRERWAFAYQSAGHTREEWLKPDLLDLLPQLKEDGHRAVIVAPIQFLADHLEVLYDIDVAAQAQAAEVGMKLFRPGSLNTSPLLIDALARVVQDELTSTN
ncbi:MAG: ferrochelatase [Chloroflexi bacterium]|nr:ferrochelatase [Chloroflexota bacterium]